MFRFSFKKYVFIIAAILFTLSAFTVLAEADESGSESESEIFAPLSKVFMNWTKPDKAQSILRVKSDSNAELKSESEISPPSYNGLIPSPIDRSTLWDNPPIPEDENTSGRIRVKAASSQYNLNDLSRLPSIRSQSPWGTCWAHAALGSLESSIITRYQEHNIDLSEFHLAYFVYGDEREGKHFGTYDNDDILDQGGNADQAAAFLSRAGTVNEATLKYPSSSNKKYTAPSGYPEDYASSGYFLKDAYMLGPNEAAAPSDTIINTIKDLVTQNGAVYMSYYAGNGAYSANSSVYVYYDKTKGTITNHAVCIVGWDDTFDKSNFAKTTSGTPSKNGAWLVRNSWGYWWGDNGYFWMPYEQPIAEISQFITEKVDRSLKSYVYDDLGMTGGVSSHLYGANIFQADDDEIFQYIGYYTRSNNENVELVIYDLGTSKPFSPLPGNTTGQSGSYIYSRNFKVPYAGYHTEDLVSLSRKIAKGHYFSVVMKFSSWTPIEMSAPWGNGKPYAAPVCNTGESYLSHNGTSWISSSNNVCIKAFTIQDPNPDSSSSLAISGTLPDGTVGQSYSATLTASGGSGSYTWTYSGGAPGLKFAPSGAAATISGTPTTAGTYNSVTVTLKDSKGSTCSQIYTVKISANSAISINGTMPARGSKNNYYYSQLTALGGTAPYTWSIADINKAPPGLSLSSNTGSTVEITGLTTSIGNYEFTVNVKDSKGLTASKVFNVIISSTPDKQLYLAGTGTLTAGTVGTMYSKNTTVTGGPTLPCHFYHTGTLPPGLIRSDEAKKDGTNIVGYPTTLGTYNFTIYAVDANNYPASGNFTLTINPSASSSLAINGALSNGTANTSYSSSLTVSGGNAAYTWSVSSGSLPPGLKLTSSGTTCTISGTPTTPGTYAFIIQVKDSTGLTASKSCTITISNPVLVISGTLPNASAGVKYTGTLSASGGTSPYTWKLLSGTLPKGLTLNASTGAITGTPTVSGSYTFTLQVTDSKGFTGTKAFTIKVTGSVAALAIITSSLTTMGYQGSSYSGELKASGGIAPYTWTYSGTLPSGMTFSSSGNTAKLTGVPTATGIFTFTVNLSDSIGTSISKIYTLTIQTKQNLNVNGTFPAGTKGASYSRTANVSGGTAPYTWTYSGKIPSGLKLALSNKNGTSVILSGTTSSAGTYTFTLKAKDKNGLTGEKMFTVSVTQLNLTGTFAAGAAKKSYSSTITASGGVTPYKWSYSGKLPPGLKLSYSGSNVTLSGTPTTGGRFTFTLKMTDSNKVTFSKSFSVSISTAPTLSGSLGTTASAGKSYSGKVSVSGGTSPYTWTYSGTLPPGLNLKSSGSSATVSGTPTTAGKFAFTIKLTDKNGVSVSKSFTITVTKMAISGTFTATGTLKKSYASSVKASGGATPYKWTKSSGTLPTGLKLTYSGATAKLTGKPTKAGTFKFTLKVTDKNGGTDTKTFTISVPTASKSDSNSKSKSSLTITGTLSSGTVKKYYSQSLKVTGGTASYKWRRSSGKLPTGLKLSSSGKTAKLYGTPKKAGTFSFTVKVTDKNKKTATKKFTVKIAAAGSTNKDNDNTATIETTKNVTTAESANKSSSGITANTAVIAVPGSTNNNYIHVNKIELDIVKSENIIARGSGYDEDLITVRAGRPITFTIGEYTGTDGKKAVLRDLRVFVDFKYNEDIIISSEDGAFTIPAELVNGDFTVSVKGIYQGLEAESEELYIEAQ